LEEKMYKILAKFQLRRQVKHDFHCTGFKENYSVQQTPTNGLIAGTTSQTGAWTAGTCGETTSSSLKRHKLPLERNS
jgi:hypothetical protein